MTGPTRLPDELTATLGADNGDNDTPGITGCGWGE